MSVHVIYYKDGAKMMRPVLSRPEYLALRNGGDQVQTVAAIREGDASLKHKLVQMNYSCLPNEDGSLKGSKRMSTTVGMDIDWTPSLANPEGEEQTAVSKEEWLKKVPELVMGKKEELGLMMLECSATKGYHLVFRRRPELSQEEDLRWASELLGVAYDKGAKDITRVFFTTTASEEEDLIYLDDEIFEINEVKNERVKNEKLAGAEMADGNSADACSVDSAPSLTGRAGGESGPSFPTHYHGIPFETILKKYWEVNNRGFEPTQGDRDTLTYQLACDLRHICGRNFEWLDQVIPCYDGFPIEEKRAKIKSALSSEFNGFPVRLRNVLNALQTETQAPLSSPEGDTIPDDNDEVYSSPLGGLKGGPRLPQGIKDSIDAVGSQLAMPVVTAICPCIGALATGVKLDVHGQQKGLNLIAYIAGDFASGKGSIDPVVDAWMSEVKALDTMYQQQEEEWRAKKRAAKNKKEQPEEPKLPVRCLTLNNTVANLAERLANTEGKHAFSFTPEADTVAQKWRSTMSDFSVMLRQSYDGTSYEREARSAEAVNVHIQRLLWNVVMCGTPDALYRVVSNYTDGFQSRIAVARTPDNTFAPLEEKPHVLTELQQERIQQVAHLLPLMQGEVVLPKLEAKGREWLERIRLETMKNDDKVRARQRFRVCVTAQRMTCCLMLCKVCETLIQKHGLNGAEAQLKQKASLWKEFLTKAQTPTMLEVFDVIADALLENALHFFRDRIENAFMSRDYAGSNDRQRMGKNDSIYERLEVEFTFDQAFQQSVAVKGASVTRNSIRQMLKNWKKQGLIVQTEAVRYRKIEN